jgi:hypothetical protein
VSLDVPDAASAPPWQYAHRANGVAGNDKNGMSHTATQPQQQSGKNAEDKHVPVRGYMRAMIKVRIE